MGPDLHWKSWRLVSADLETGALTGLSQWKGGTLPNVGDSNGRIIGAQYNLKHSARSDVLVSLDGNPSSLFCFDTKAQRAAANVPVTFGGAYFDEVEGFFSLAQVDDVQPYNTKFSLYDAMTLTDPQHFAVVDAGKTLMYVNLAQNYHINTVSEVDYVATQAFDGNSSIFRVQRITGEVTKVTFPQESDPSLQIHDIFAKPSAADQELLVAVMCGVKAVEGCKLFEVDVKKGTSTVLVELPHMQPGDADTHCKSFHKESNVFYLGCENVHAVNLETHAVSNVTLQKTKSDSRGGDYRLGGFVVLEESTAVMLV